jgi:hypothetical protein
MEDLNYFAKVANIREFHEKPLPISPGAKKGRVLRDRALLVMIGIPVVLDIQFQFFDGSREPEKFVDLIIIFRIRYLVIGVFGKFEPVLFEPESFHNRHHLFRA